MFIKRGFSIFAEPIYLLHVWCTLLILETPHIPLHAAEVNHKCLCYSCTKEKLKYLFALWEDVFYKIKATPKFCFNVQFNA